MMLKKTALTLALSLGLVAGANAADFNLGVIAVPSTLGSSAMVTGSFFDTWSFSIAQPTYASGAVTALNMTNVWQINDLDVYLMKGIYGDAAADTVVQHLTGDAVTKTGFGTQDAGNYFFTVAGVGAGPAGAGAYGFAAVTALPVPEPESYAMLIAGLGLMGTIARRRKSKAA